MSALVIVALVCLLLFLHPYTFYPLSIMLFPARPVRRDPGAPRPTASAVFAAYNEARSIPAKIANLRAIHELAPDIEFIAYADLSSDATLSMLQAEPDLVTVIAATERTGKATGMEKMVAMARGEICIFTDANVTLDPASVAPLLSYFSDPEVGGVAGTLLYVNEGESTTAKAGGLYWRLEERVKQLESRCGSIMGADGSIFATRRALYPVVPPHLLDDMTTSMSVTFHGKRLVHATDVIAYEKSATSSSDEFRRKRRIACRAFNTHRHLWPAIRKTYSAADLYKYVSHKILRWFGIVPLALLILFGGAAMILAQLWYTLAVILALGAVLFGLAVAGIQPFALLVEILKSIIATFVGVVDSMRGKTYQTWEPAKSRD